MPTQNYDLASLFQAVTQSLQENQQSLNQVDNLNHDHGSNMAQTFETITKALEQKKGSSASTALAYAAKTLTKTTSSGSGKLYAQNLTTAAGLFKGKKIDAQGAVQLLQTLIGGGQAAAQGGAQSGGANMLGALLGGLTAGEEQPQQQTGGADMLSSLLGGLGGGSSSQQQGSGLDLGDLLNAGAAFMQARQQGQGTLPAIIQAITAGSGMGDSVHRNQSTQLVVQSFMQALSGMTK